MTLFQLNLTVFRPNRFSRNKLRIVIKKSFYIRNLRTSKALFAIYVGQNRNGPIYLIIIQFLERRAYYCKHLIKLIGFFPVRPNISMNCQTVPLYSGPAAMTLE